jgi:hypothetical protein
MTTPNTASEVTWADNRSLRPDGPAAFRGKPLATVSRCSRRAYELARYLTVYGQSSADVLRNSAAVCAALEREECDESGIWKAATADIVVGHQASADGTDTLESTDCVIVAGHIR